MYWTDNDDNAAGADDDDDDDVVDVIDITFTCRHVQLFSVAATITV